MRACALKPDDSGKRITWTDRTGQHSMILGHVHVEESATGPTVVLIRERGADPWDAWTLDGRRRVQVTP